MSADLRRAMLLYTQGERTWTPSTHEHISLAQPGSLKILDNPRNVAEPLAKCSPQAFKVVFGFSPADRVPVCPHLRPLLLFFAKHLAPLDNIFVYVPSTEKSCCVWEHDLLGLYEIFLVVRREEGWLVHTDKYLLASCESPDVITLHLFLQKYAK